MSKQDVTHESTTMASGCFSRLLVPKSTEKSPGLVLPFAFSTSPIVEGRGTYLEPADGWTRWASAQPEDESVFEFREVGKSLVVARASSVSLWSDAGGRWFLRYRVDVFVGTHSWRWNLRALTATADPQLPGHEAFKISTRQEIRRHGVHYVETWGTSKDLAALKDQVRAWSLTGSGTFSYEDEG